MNDKPENRQTRRVRGAIKSAFVQLLRESSYEAITVSDIAERADVGRSTFYHHYQSKADVLLSWHEDIFGALQIARTTATGWLSDDPPEPLVTFFERMLKSRMPLVDLGNDASFVLRGIGLALTAQIEESLIRSFPDMQANMPLPVVAQTVAGIYVWIFYWWVMGHPAYSPAEMASYTHRMVRGAIVTVGISAPDISSTPNS
jgi:AcrR family transcriptional regulator